MLNQNTAEMSRIETTQPEPNGKKVKNKKVKTRIFIACMLAYPLLHFIVFWFFVNINSIIMTFQDYSWTQQKTIFVGFKNYIKVFDDLRNLSSAKTMLINSILYMPVTCFISLPLSILFSYFLYKKVPFAGVFRVIFFLPSIIPIVVLTMTFSFMFDATMGPVNMLLKALGLPASSLPSWFGQYPLNQLMIFVYCIWAGLGYNIILIAGAISRLPEEIMEYNKIEGLGMTREMFQIVIPLVWPTITTTFLLGCTSIFTVTLHPLMLTPGHPDTGTIGLLIYNAANNNSNLEYATTMGLSLSLMGVPIVMLVRWLLGKVYEDVEF